MKNKIKHSAEIVAKACVVSSLLLLAAEAQALGLSDIKVKSYLGEPLKAQFLVMQLPEGDTQDIKVRLAGVDEYQKMNLAYPVGVMFNFDIVRQKGKDVVVKVSTNAPIEDPFVNLLVEFTSSSGKITRGYTFLLDPSPGFISEPAANVSPSNFSTGAKHNNTSTASSSSNLSSGRFIFDQGSATYTEEKKSSSKKRRKSDSFVADDNQGQAASTPVKEKRSKPTKAVTTEQTNAAPKKEPHNKRKEEKPVNNKAATDSNSLSISKNAPTSSAAKDALQEEQVAKDKAMKEMSGQPSAAPTTKTAQAGVAGATGTAATSGATTDIPPLPTNIGMVGDATSATAPSNTTDTAPTNAGEVVAPVVEVPAPAPTPAPIVLNQDSSSSLLDVVNEYWAALIGALVLILLAIAGGLVYNKRKKQGGAWKSTATDKKATPEKAKADPKPIVNKAAEKATDKEKKPSGFSLFKSGLFSKKKPQSTFGKPAVKEDAKGSATPTPIITTPPIEQKTETPVITPAPIEPKPIVVPPVDLPEPAVKLEPPAVVTEPPVPPAKELANEAFDEAIVKPQVEEKPLEFPSNGTTKIKQPAIKQPPTIKEPPPSSTASSQQESEEFNLLEEADIYLRFGHNKLAEEVLREAIKLNGKNAKSYLTLLGILEARGDSKEFSEIAEQLKALNDPDSWQKASAMGQKIDPNNPLYAS